MAKSDPFEIKSITLNERDVLMSLLCQYIHLIEKIDQGLIDGIKKRDISRMIGDLKIAIVPYHMLLANMRPPSEGNPWPQEIGIPE